MNQPTVSERAARTQERILDAARDLVTQQGARKVTITEVARTAGVGKGTAYQYWPTKEDVVIAVQAREMARGLNSVLDALEHDPSAALASRLAPLLLESQQSSETLARLRDDPDAVLLLARHDAARAVLDVAAPLSLCRGAVHELRRQALLEPSQDEAEQVYALHALINGFAQADLDAASAGLVPDASARRALLVRTVHQAIETDSKPAPSALAAAAEALSNLLRDAQAELARLYAPAPDRAA